MSKKNKRNKYKRGIQRDNNYITKLNKELLSSSFYFQDRKRWWQDRRRFQPEDKVYDIYHKPSKIIAGSPDDTEKYYTNKLHFKSPFKETVCLKRKARRLNLFRKGKVGKGKKVSERRKRNIFSNIKC